MDESSWDTIIFSELRGHKMTRCYAKLLYKSIAFSEEGGLLARRLQTHEINVNISTNICDVMHDDHVFTQIRIEESIL